MKRSSVLIILAVNFLEWLEFSLYLYLAKSVFAVEFFPDSNNSLTLTFALFATAYLARPVGGWIFGREADTSGRCKPMITTAALMGCATIGICLLPGFSQMGMLATWLLLLFRVMQGVALGGEVNTSAMFSIEHNNQSPLMAGALVAACGALGMFMGSALAAYLQMAYVPGLWRVVFAVVGFISLWVCCLRKKLAESPEFSEQLAGQIDNLWVNYWRGMLNIAAIAAFVSVTIYLCNVFWVSFATDKVLCSGAYCAWAGALAQLSSAILAIIIARLNKPIHAKFILQMSMLIIAVSAPALFYFTQYNNLPGIVCALMGYILSNGLLCASLYYFLYQQLPPQYRCRGVSIIWALAASLGAISLPIAEAMVSQYKQFWFPGILVSGVALLSFFIVRHNTGQSSARINKMQIA